jgi:eukaryotic-like serine/threonine-protein kinase
VYLGRVRGAVGFARTVAIKRLHKHLAGDREFVAMFLDEGRLASRIRHPNVVPTLDVVSDEGELFLVMEYVHGETLSAISRAVCAAGASVPLPVAAAIVSSTLLGLHAAHEATDEEGRPLELVHRDVSPQNIIVGSDGVARLVDFGVSKATGRLQSTGEGQIKGKLGYMAPESFRGTVDRRGDVYATAVVLWELLTGTRLFTGSHAEVLAKILAGEVPPPISIRPDLPAALDEIVMCGLEFDPERRFPTARAMERALRRATPIATTFEVAEWLDATVGDSLRDRAARVAEIEKSTRIALVAEPEPARRGVRRAAVIAGVLAIASAAIASALLVARSTPHVGSVPIAAPAPSIAVVEVTPPQAGIREAAAVVASEPAVSAAAATPPPSTLAARVLPKASGTPAASRVRAEAKARPAKPAACAVPYTVDAQGSTHFLLECIDR